MHQKEVLYSPFFKILSSPIHPSDTPRTRIRKHIERSPIKTSLLFIFVCSVVLTCSILLYAGASGKLRLRHIFQEQINQKKTTLISFIENLDKAVLHVWFRAIAAGSGVMLFTWMITFFDSYKPGINPPVPCANPKITSYHRFHLNYIFAILNGLATVFMWI